MSLIKYKKIMALYSIIALLLFFKICYVKCDPDMRVPCGNDTMCKSHFSNNSICRGGDCVCPDSDGKLKYCVLPDKTLKEPRTLGAVISRICKHDIDCGPENTMCNTTNNQCQCKHQYVADSTNTKCLPIVNSIGGKCTDSKQCLVNFPSTTCSDNQCICTNGYHHINGKCWKSVGFAENCTANQECLHVEHAECNEKQNVCACSANSALNSDGKKCLPLARSIMEECHESVQCTKSFMEAECVDKRCQCYTKSHFVPSISKCISNKELGEACSADYDCYQGVLSQEMNSLKCTDRICVCAEGFTNTNGRCVATGVAVIHRLSTGLIIILLLVVKVFS